MAKFKEISIKAGNGAISGLIEGMDEEKDALQKKVLEIADLIERSLSTGLDAHSPSRLTAKYGGFAAQGVTVGWDEEIGHFKDTVLASMPASFDVPAPQTNGAKLFSPVMDAISTLTGNLSERGGSPQPATIIITLGNGVELARAQIADIRSVDAQSPQVARDF